MDQSERKARIREYKETPLPAGIFCVRNTTTGKMLVGSSPNLPGMLNRQRFQLESGMHPDKELQKDWNELRPDAFAFEELDRLEPPTQLAGAAGSESQGDQDPELPHGLADDRSSEPPSDTPSDPTEDLRVLLEMWLEKLTASGAVLYPRSR